jgi:hypothetical protein
MIDRIRNEWNTAFDVTNNETPRIDLILNDYIQNEQREED